MAQIDLGKLKFNWRGAWNNTATYETDDVVFRNGSSFVAREDFAAGQPAPEENNDWDLMSQGINYRETYNAATTYYLNDVVLYGSTLYILNGITEDDEQTGTDPPGGNWSVFLPQAAADVLHAPGDMVYRNNEDNAARMVSVEQVGAGVHLVEEPRETYASQAFTYELNGTFGNTILTAASVPAETYNITLANVRNDHYVLTGEDRNGNIFEKQDYALTVNIGDTIIFDATATNADHPLEIRQTSATGDAVDEGTLTGNSTATVTWDTTGVTAGTYYYACDNHEAAMGSTITVVDPTNRQGAADANGVIDVSRGQTYTITIDNATDQVTYNLFAGAAAQQTGAANALTADEGNSGGVEYTTGNPVTITFTPNQTTPDIVHITSQANTADNVTINVHDLTWAPAYQRNRVYLGDDAYTPPAALPANAGVVLASDTQGTLTWGPVTNQWALISDSVGETNRAIAANSWTTRVLDNIDYNPNNIVALDTGTSTMTLQAGTYWFQAYCPGHDGATCQTRLREITPTGQDAITGKVEYAHPTYPCDTSLCIEGIITPTEETTYRIQQRASSAASNFFSRNNTGFSQEQRITTVRIIKIA